MEYKLNGKEEARRLLKIREEDSEASLSLGNLDSKSQREREREANYFVIIKIFVIPTLKLRKKLSFLYLWMDQVFNKVGSYWLGQKASQEFSSVGKDVNVTSEPLFLFLVSFELRFCNCIFECLARFQIIWVLIFAAFWILLKDVWLAINLTGCESSNIV